MMDLVSAFNRHTSVFRRSLTKLNVQKYFSVVAYDTAFWVVAAIAYTLLMRVLTRNYDAVVGVVERISLMQVALTQANVQREHAIVGSSVSSSIAFFLVFLVVVFIVWCMSRLLIWDTLLDKKYSFVQLKRFLLLNLVWQPLNLVLVVVMLTLLSVVSVLLAEFYHGLQVSGYSSVALTVISALPLLLIIFPFVFFVMHVTNLLYYFFASYDGAKGLSKRSGAGMKGHKNIHGRRGARRPGFIGSSFTRTFEMIVFHFQTLIMSYYLMSVVMVVVVSVPWFFGDPSAAAYSYASLVVFVLFSSWSKQYFISVLE